MRIRFKQAGFFGDKMIEAKSRVENVLVKKDILHPEKDRVLIFFEGGNASGAVNLNQEEADSLLKSLQKNVNLVKKSEKFS